MRRLGLAAAALLLAACAARADRQKQQQPSLAELQRDVTVVVFWATWCGPCRQELPLVEALHQKYKDDPQVRVVAVSVDHARKATAARKVAADLRLTMPLVTDGEATYYRFFGGDDTDVPRLAIVDRRQAGLERMGAVSDERAEGFVRDVSAAVESVRAGSPKPPTALWKPFTARR